MAQKGQKYWDALDRLLNNKPNVLVRGDYSINNDSVALEAGDGRGAIKKARYPELILAIIDAGKQHKDKAISPVAKQKIRVDKAKDKLKDLEARYAAALNRELELIIKLEKVQKDNDYLRSINRVVDIGSQE